jgi:hypothetical protein
MRARIVAVVCITCNDARLSFTDAGQSVCACTESPKSWLRLQGPWAFAGLGRACMDRGHNTTGQFSCGRALETSSIKDRIRSPSM